MNLPSRATELFSGFSTLQLPVNETTINAVRGGSGPPVLLLHGYPQTHATWHRVAPLLAERFTVVCSDLRGYGDSAKPGSDDSHEPYSKRMMARDQLELMRSLGFERFALVGHDRGARVARRLALDHPDSVSRLAVLDIVPTATIYATLGQRLAMTVWRYFFLVQPCRSARTADRRRSRLLPRQHPRRVVRNPRLARRDRRFRVPALLRPENRARELRGLPRRRHD